MANYTAIRDQIKIILNTVSNIGTVIDWPKSSIDPSIFERDFLNVDADGVTEVRAWAIARRQITVDYGAAGGGIGSHYAKFNELSIFGLMSVDDERSTWNTFNDLIDAVVAALSLKIDLNGTVFVVQGGPVIQTIDQREVGGRILHYTEIRLRTMEQIGPVTFG